MHFSTEGIVIKQTKIREADCLLTILTKERGLIRAFLRGGKKIKSPLVSATELLCYCNFNFFEGKNSIVVDSAEPVEIFFELREDIEKLSLAFYFAEVSGFASPEHVESEDFLRLLLNSLYFLSKTDKNSKIIKSVFELRSAVILGVAPDLTACDACSRFDSEYMYFDFVEGNLLCENCNEDNDRIKLPISVVSSMRHVIFSDLKGAFKFSLGDENLIFLNFITENYLIVNTDHEFKTLDFYKNLFGEENAKEES